MTRAAAELGYSQPAITAQIRALESNFSTSFFERRRDGVRLTSSGERFLPYVTRILKLAEEAKNALTLGSTMEGALCIGATESVTTYRLPEVIECFHHRFPRVRLSLRTFHDGAETIFRSLDNGEIDAAVLHSMSLDPGGRHVAKIAEEDVVLVAAAGHPLAEQTSLTSHSLDDTSVLIAQPGCVYAAMLRQDDSGIAANAAQTLQFGTIEAVKKAVAAGLGVSALPRIAVTDLIAKHEVVALPWHPPTTPSTYLAWGEFQAEQELVQSLLSVLKQSTGSGAQRDDLAARRSHLKKTA